MPYLLFFRLHDIFEESTNIKNTCTIWLNNDGNEGEENVIL